MSLFLTQLMNGIGSGAVYASIALALVLVFRTTGILNFAQGEMALYSTYLVWFFTQRSVPVWIAIVLAMIISFVGGAAIERILIRPVLLNRTRIGLAFRAVASNPESSRLVGVPVGRMLMLGWGMAAAIGALAGALVIAPVGLQGASMQEILVYSFAAAALGGFDSPLGAVVAGLIVGVAGTMTTQYLHVVHDIELVVPFGLILVVLLVRPSGLFGSQRVERV